MHSIVRGPIIVTLIFAIAACKMEPDSSLGTISPKPPGPSVSLRPPAPNSALEHVSSSLPTPSVSLRPPAPASSPRVASLPTIYTGLGNAGFPRVRAFREKGDSVTANTSLLAYAPSFRGDVTVASADFNLDGIPDIVTGAGPGGGPHVRIFDGASGADLASFMAYDPSVLSGVYVAAADMNRDGTPDVITGPGPGPKSRVRIFDGNTLAMTSDFLAYDSNWIGGVRVAVGDCDGDGLLEIITGAGPGGGAHVKVFSGTNYAEVSGFFAFPDFAGGVFVAAADFDGDGLAEVVVSPDSGMAPIVRISSPEGVELRSFNAYDPIFLGGVRVASVDVDNDAIPDIVTGAGPGGAAHVRVFHGKSLAVLGNFYAEDVEFRGGVHVAGALGLTGAVINWDANMPDLGLLPVPPVPTDSPVTPATEGLYVVRFVSILPGFGVSYTLSPPDLPGFEIQHVVMGMGVQLFQVGDAIRVLSAGLSAQGNEQDVLVTGTVLSTELILHPSEWRLPPGCSLTLFGAMGGRFGPLKVRTLSPCQYSTGQNASIWIAHNPVAAGSGTLTFLPLPDGSIPMSLVSFPAVIGGN